MDLDAYLGSYLNADLDKGKNSRWGVGFDSYSEFSLPDGTMGKNVIVFGVDMSSSMHVDHKGKDILIPGEEPTQRLDDITLRAEARYSINFAQSEKKICIKFKL